MNTLRNKVQLIGRLGGEPEIVTFQDGNSGHKEKRQCKSQIGKPVNF